MKKIFLIIFSSTILNIAASSSCSSSQGSLTNLASSENLNKLGQIIRDQLSVDSFEKVSYMPLNYNNLDNTIGLGGNNKVTSTASFHFIHHDKKITLKCIEATHNIIEEKISLNECTWINGWSIFTSNRIDKSLDFPTSSGHFSSSC